MPMKYRSDARSHCQHKTKHKKLFSPLKHSKHDSASLQSLKSQNNLHRDAVSKATALNKQFQSVLNSTSPLNIASYCKIKLSTSIVTT